MDFLKDRYPDLELVILEDGHQTAAVGRDLDILILDRWQVVPGVGPGRIAPVTGPVVPFGPWRESAQGGRRAAIWLLETAEPGPGEGIDGQDVVRFQRRLTLERPSGPAPEGSVSGCAALLSGIARPEGFESSVTGMLEDPAVLAVRCGDHAEYGPRVVARIIAAVRRAGADFLVTTAKDWVKLEPFLPAGLEVLVTDLSIVWEDGKALPALVRERLAEEGRR
jgi:tetraacyldisaccharide-1-P 4'-kinase